MLPHTANIRVLCELYDQNMINYYQEAGVFQSRKRIVSTYLMREWAQNAISCGLDLSGEIKVFA